MPHLTCPNCRLTSYSAAGHATVDRCPRCDSPLGTTPRARKALRRWNVFALRDATQRTAAETYSGLATARSPTEKGAPTVSRGTQVAG